MEVALYEECLQKIIHKRGDKIKALLLGATPELRDLLAKYKIKTTLADINPNMIKAMGELLEYSDGKEDVVIANWLKIPSKSNEFDVVLCDHGIHHIFFEEWGNFFKEIKRLSKNGGYVLNSVVTVEEAEKLDLEQIVDVYRNNIFTLENRWYYAYRFCCGLKDIENKRFYKNLAEMNLQLRNFLKQGKISQKEFNFLELPFAISEFKFVMPTKEEVDEISAKYFKIKSVNVSFAHPMLTCHKIYFGQFEK
ncbi:MAG: methyltransferase domain-containing protein [Candidatus Moranbacteria bacterium]|nr:methyltransferase domain-containing protein [Candidatus Moranbacteria bacterium]